MHNLSDTFFLPQVERIPLRKIKVSKQVRTDFDEDELDALAQSIQEHGQRTPVEVIKRDGFMSC